MRPDRLGIVVGLWVVAVALVAGPATAANWDAASTTELIAAIEAANAAGGTNSISLAAGQTFTLTAVWNLVMAPGGSPHFQFIEPFPRF